MKSVYLAGGFARKGETDWREQVYEKFLGYWNRVIFYDPFKKEKQQGYDEIMQQDKNYWVWDKYAIRNSDIVLCYAQKTNPGIGLYLELAYAYALGKTVLLVIDNGNGEEAIPDRYREECRAFASATFYSLEEGLTFLTALL